MKMIRIMRHAKSDWSRPSLRDVDRPLNKRGRRDAPRMGRWMREHGSTPGLVVSSPALRARETAEAVCAAMGYEGEVRFRGELYPGSVRTTFEVLASLPPDVDHVLLIGHNPHLESLVSALAAGGRLQLKLPTAAVALLECDVERWAGAGERSAVLRGLVTPKQLV